MLNYPREQLESVLNNKYKNVYQIKIKNSSDSQDFAETFNKFDNELKKFFNEDDIGAFDLTNTQFEELEENDDFLNLRREFTKGTFKELYPEAIELYRIDYSIYKLMNVNIEAGRKLNKDDFNNSQEVIPMLISSSYKPVINIDEVITSRLDNRKYRVVGFFNANLSWLSDKNPVLMNIVDLNDKVITPYLIDTSGLQTVIKSQAYYYVNNSSIPENIVKNTINTIGKQFNLNVESNSLDNQLIDVENSNKESIFYGLLMSIFFIIVSCFALTIIMTYSIGMRKLELGIRIAYGASTSYIKSLVIGEVVTLMLVAFLISSVVVGQLRKGTSVSTNLINLYDVKTMIFIFLFLFIFSIISSLVPLYKISKLNPKELLKGGE